MDFILTTFNLSFTWPGGQLDEGTVSSYQVQEGSSRSRRGITPLQVFYTSNSSLLQDPLGPGLQELDKESLPTPEAAGTHASVMLGMGDFPRDR